MLLYLFARFCRFICSHLPLSFGYLLACVSGDILYLFWRRGRNSVKQNIANLLGDEANSKAVDKIARQSLRNYCKYCVDFARLSYYQLKDVEDRLIINGLENLETVLKGGNGAILVSLHMGNWDLGVAALTKRGYPLNVVVKTLRFQQMNKFVHSLRTNLGLKVIAAEEQVSKMVEVLRRNELLALLIDCPKYSNGVEINFGNGSARMPTGAAVLALRTGAQVIPCGLVRSADNTFVAVVGQPLHFQPSGELAEDIRELTQCIIIALERLIRQYPEQWYMFQPLSK